MTEKVSPPKAELDSNFGVWDEDSGSEFKKVLLYGTSGSGKTWLASTFPQPLFVDMEGGLKGVGSKKPLRFPKDRSKVVDNMKSLRAAYEAIRKALADGNAPFQTVVLDSLSEMQELVMLDVITNFTGANRLYEDQPTQADYGKANRDFLKIFRSFLRLPCNVVFTNVIAPKEFQEDQSAPKFIGKVIGPEVSRLVDAIGYTFTQAGDNKEDVKFLVSFANTPDHVGKDRLGIGVRNKPNNYNSVFGIKEK
mgnify:CR=1 FL=1